MHPKVAIIIVVWNGKADTLECLESLSHDTYPNKEIIVVDNGSSDGSAQAIADGLSGAHVVRTGENLGFTGGNNIGIRHAIGSGVDYVFLLNNDTTVEPGALTELVAAAEADASSGLLAPVIHYHETPAEVWFAGSRLDLSRGFAVHDNTRLPARDDAPYEIPWATGCAMLLKTALIRRLSGFDDRYYLTWEDVDLSLRVRAAGFRVVVVPRARICHKGGRSGRRLSPVRHYYAARNRLLLVQKHTGTAYPGAAARIVGSLVRESLRGGDRGSCWQYLLSVYHGVRDHLLGIYGPYPELSK